MSTNVYAVQRHGVRSVVNMQATDEQVGDTETDAPPLVNSIRKSTQKKVSALARLGAWGLPPDEAAPRTSHDHEDGAKQQALESRSGNRSSAGEEGMVRPAIKSRRVLRRLVARRSAGTTA